jgi:excisionase family DNA binding protein
VRRPVAKRPANPKQKSNSSTVNPRVEPRVGPRGLTIPEAADYMGATVWYVRTNIWAGELPATRRGKRFVIDRHDLDAFIERSKTTKTTTGE